VNITDERDAKLDREIDDFYRQWFAKHRHRHIGYLDAFRAGFEVRQSFGKYELDDGAAELG
jgi:hypothetical protein